MRVLPFRRILFGLAVAWVAVATMQGAGATTLVGQDCGFDAGNIQDCTLDTNTSLQWLDLTLSTNRSVDDLSGVDGSNEFLSGGDFAGWRYASQAEVRGLFQNHGFPAIDTSATALNVPFFESFAALFGVTRLFSTTTIIAAATDTIVAAGNVAKPVLQAYGSVGSYSTVAVTTTSVQLFASPNLYVGNWLVRDTDAVKIPEPGSLALFAFGLVGLGFARRGRALIRLPNPG